MTRLNEIPRLLVVEDEEMLLDVLRDTLTDAHFEVVAVATGAAVRAEIAVQAGEFDAILLDRLLPDMDALALMPEIKSNPALAHVPVIIQTSMTRAEDIVAGLAAGAYYYLTKPFPPETLLSIVRAAVEDHRHFRHMQESLEQAQSMMQHLERGEFVFRTSGEARQLAMQIAHVAPDAGRVVLGLTELMLNAVEHGNLAITYDEKSRLIAGDSLAIEIERRLADPRYASRMVRVGIERQPDALCFTIRDEGAGFDWQGYLDMSPERAFDTHGRGIAMSRMISFDTMEYRGCGNEVCCRVITSRE
jgi:DNA-binding response OmpR family regulator